MVHLFYTVIANRMPTSPFNDYLQELPYSIRERVTGFKNWQDAERCLLGHCLLKHAMNYLKLDTYSLNELQYTEFEKPFFDDLISFNISHSGKYVVCGISINSKIGVDIEEMEPVLIADFENQFSAMEWKEIKKDDTTATFYKYWTQKESFLKAIGLGVNAELKNINFVDGKINWEDQNWYVKQIYIDEGYVCHLASNHPSIEIKMKEVKFDRNRIPD
jgi:4'-phosphopantetheinyl transferase